MRRSSRNKAIVLHLGAIDGINGLLVSEMMMGLHSVSGLLVGFDGRGDDVSVVSIEGVEGL